MVAFEDNSTTTKTATRGGNKFETVYDSKGNKLSWTITQKDGTTTIENYDSKGNVTSRKSATPDGKSKTTYYDSKGKVTSTEVEVTTNGGTNKTTYDSEGNKISWASTQKNGTKAEAHYRDGGILTDSTLTKPDGTTVYKHYYSSDSILDETKTTTPDGRIIDELYHDSKGKNVRMRMEITPDNKMTRVYYDKEHNITYREIGTYNRETGNFTDYKFFDAEGNEIESPD